MLLVSQLPNTSERWQTSNCLRETSSWSSAWSRLETTWRRAMRCGHSGATLYDARRHDRSRGYNFNVHCSTVGKAIANAQFQYFSGANDIRLCARYSACLRPNSIFSSIVVKLYYTRTWPTGVKLFSYTEPSLPDINSFHLAVQ